MDSCTICRDPVVGPRLTDARSGRHAHPACVAAQVPQDAIVAVLAALVLVLVPTVIVWAG